MKRQSKNQVPFQSLYPHDWLVCPAVEQIPGKVSGDLVFRGTRVPIRALFENLRDGASIEDFLNWSPGVRRDQVEAVRDYQVSVE